MYPAVYEGKIYFAATDGVNGYELWTFDGLSASPALEQDINPTGDESPAFLTVFRDELYFLASGASQLTKDKLDGGTCYISDYVFDKALVYASTWLKGGDLIKYKKHYDSVRESVTEPVVVIYLVDTVENCMERIHQRNRSYEQHIELPFLKHLADGYEKLYTDYTVCPLIRIYANECRQSGQVDRIAHEIRYYIESSNKV